MAASQKTATEQIEELTGELNRHNEAYYQKSAPTIPDSEFDRLLRELRDLEDKHPELKKPDSPTQRVGGKPDEQFDSYLHNPPMLSLDNAFPADDDSDDDLQKFHERAMKGLEGREPEYFAELKIDGMSINLIYENGKLTKGVTRGNGKDED